MHARRSPLPSMNTMTLFRTATATFLLMLFVRSVAAADFYVSPTGNDGNLGAIDSPVLTLGKAKSLARQLAGMESVTVHVADGVYYLPETLVFEPADSGSAEYPVVYAAENEGGAVLSGGTKLNLAWQPYRDGIFRPRLPLDWSSTNSSSMARTSEWHAIPNYDASKKTEAVSGIRG